MYKEKEKEKEKQKLTVFYSFISKLRAEKKLKLSEKEFNKELILFFNITDFRAIASKTKLMETLDLIEKKSIQWEGVEIWIKEKH